MVANVDTLATLDNIALAVDKSRPNELSQKPTDFANYAKNQPILRVLFCLFDRFVDFGWFGCSCRSLVFVAFHYILQEIVLIIFYALVAPVTVPMMIAATSSIERCVLSIYTES